MTCGKLIKKGIMNEFRPCIQNHNHKGRCGSPDLSGMTFGNLLAMRPTTPYHNAKGERTWIVRNLANETETIIPAVKLIRGETKGLRSYRYKINGIKSPEYATIYSHWYSIYKSSAKHAHVYKNMPFFEDWNPDKGGAFWKGAKWIADNLGSKPGPNWSMDVIKHELGFVPGNLRWAQRSTQRRNQQHRTLGQFTDEEFAVEARRRGYLLIKGELPSLTQR